MAQDKDKIYELAKQVIEEKRPIWIEELISFLPISKFTFYSYFPIGSNESNELKDLIDKCKCATKNQLRYKWLKSDNATLQLALYKLIATKEEREALSMTTDNKDNETVIRLVRD